MEEIRSEQDLQLRLTQLSPSIREKAEILLKSGRKLRAIGYWIGKGDPGLPHPKIFQDKNWDAAERQMVIDYLKKASPVIGYMGLSWCRYQCGEAGMGACDLSDGIYCWPEGLSHYVGKHAVRLPDEFVEHARKNQHTAPLPKMDADTQLLAFVAPDFSWWKLQTGWNR